MSGWINSLLSRFPEIKVDFLCRQWQVEAIKAGSNQSTLGDYPHVRYFDLPSPGVSWSKTPDIYRDGRLIGWVDELKSFDPLKTADIVISDNLSGILSIRPDAILMGSFLWMEVLEIYKDIPEVSAYMEHEKNLLEQNRPYMICVDTIAMPAVRKYTRVVGMPWFGTGTKSASKEVRKRNTIALVGGATPAADQVLLNTARALLQTTDYRILVAQRFHDMLGKLAPERCGIFDFKKEDYEACDLVICRAGVGTLTDCIVTNTPMLLLPETANAEMEYNTVRLEQLGLAKGLETGFSEDILCAEIADIFKKERYAAYSKALQEQPVNGFEKAIDWFTSQYSIH